MTWTRTKILSVDLLGAEAIQVGTDLFSLHQARRLIWGRGFHRDALEWHWIPSFSPNWGGGWEGDRGLQTY